MSAEIERKYTVKDQSYRQESIECKYYKQGYISIDKERTVRIRISGNNAFITLKGVTTGCTRWEIDEFMDNNDGLVIAEIELKSESEQFDLPPFIETEVTGDPRYYNSNLAKHPYKTWKEKE